MKHINGSDESKTTCGMDGQFEGVKCKRDLSGAKKNVLVSNQS